MNDPVDIVSQHLARQMGLEPDDDDRERAQVLLAEVWAAGWRIVRTDPNTEPGERPILLEEWTP